MKGKENFETEDNSSNTDTEVLFLLGFFWSLCFWFKPLLGGALKAKQLKVEIKARGEGFFGNQRNISTFQLSKKETSLDFSSQKFARAQSSRGRWFSARLCPQIAQTHTPP